MPACFCLPWQCFRGQHRDALPIDGNSATVRRKHLIGQRQANVNTCRPPKYSRTTAAGDEDYQPERHLSLDTGNGHLKSIIYRHLNSTTTTTSAATTTMMVFVLRRLTFRSTPTLLKNCCGGGPHQRQPFRNLSQQQQQQKYRIAVIGSGPAGFYTTQQLLKNHNVSVDIYEKFPVPFGLVRFGVAPDHQEVKNVINSFTKVAMNERTRFIGNINIGGGDVGGSGCDVTLAELRQAYHAVVLCYGSSQDALLGIPGESEHRNVISARRFVGWYNGIPADRDLDVQLDSDTETAVIIGQGNVALDCARILLLSRECLKRTDITRHAYRRLADSRVRRVIIIGRRGPMQAAYKIKEFRELTKMEDCRLRIELSGQQEREALSFSDELLNSLPRPRRRFAELYKRIIEEEETAGHRNKSYQKECILRFFQSPVEILGSRSRDGSPSTSVSGIRLKRNLLSDYISEDAKVVGEGEGAALEELPCGLLIRSIGYRSTALDDRLPFDARRGVIRNDCGRVEDSPGLYCSGWAAFGATGVILNTMNASFEVGKNILADLEAGRLQVASSSGERTGFERIEPLLRARGANVVDFVDWTAIDEYERQQGRKEGKPREKVVSVDEILKLKEEKTASKKGKDRRGGESDDETPLR